MEFSHSDATMRCAMNGRANKNFGFEGCKAPECNFPGYYLCKYSQEGYCYPCELKHFPERFQGCLFCRSPQTYTGACLICSSDIRKWIVEISGHKDCFKIYHLIEMGLNCLLGKKQTKMPFIGNNLTFPNKWPGFYSGDNKWIIPNAPKKPIDVSNLTWENKDIFVEQELEKMEIFIWNDIQI